MTLVVISLFAVSFANAQSALNDLELLNGKQSAEMKYYDGNNGNTSKYIQDKSFWQKINPLKYTLGATMYVYQNVISPQLSSGCQYEMVCSNFSKHAIEEFGWVKGMALSADRLLRCNPVNIQELPYIYRTTSGQIKDAPEKYRIN